jgi:hypothetical protein
MANKRIRSLSVMVAGLIILNLFISPVFAADSKNDARIAYDKALVLQKSAEENESAKTITRGIRCVSYILFAIYHQNEEIIRLNEETIKLLKENNAGKGTRGLR